MRLRTFLHSAFWICFSVIGISLLVPEESPEAEIHISEEFRSARLSATGSSLLIRSSDYDYQFALPPNELNAAFALTLEERMKCSLHDAVFDSQTGEAGIDFDVYYGRYDMPLSKDVRSALARLGFTPSSIDTIGFEGPELYMVWGQGSGRNEESGLKGKRYPPGALPEPAGQDISACIDDEGLHSVTVKLDAETIRKNQWVNTLLLPFHAVREGIQGFFFFILVMLFGWGGGG